MKKAPFKIGSKLKNRETGQIVILNRYGTQMVIGMSIRTSRSTTKQKTEFQYFLWQGCSD